MTNLNGFLSYVIYLGNLLLSLKTALNMAIQLFPAMVLLFFLKSFFIQHYLELLVFLILIHCIFATASLLKIVT